jgi:catechol 2,3-dioxygenase-like lactoylglutathione lyase family enzyme
MTEPVFHRGRLIDHVHLRCRDLEASKRFYRAVLAAVGREVTSESDRHLGADELWMDAAEDKPTTGLHLAFAAADQDTVARFHKAALANGGLDNGAPGERSYHPGYYAAFAFDPDGNNIEAVFHGKALRNVDSVELKLAPPG